MLFLVATPIGNLSDLSLRAAKTLASSDVILAEDTRSARILLGFIKKSFPQLFPNLLYPPKLQRRKANLPNFPSSPNHPNIVSYYKEIEFQKLPEILDLLKVGKNISLISESGMPLISDPGYLLVKTCIKQNIPFTVIPGPSAVTTALLYSGFNPENFLFLGFLPKSESKLYQCINTLIQIKKILQKTVFIFYESPKRINKSLEIISKVLPEIEVCICREMTKKFEEIIRGKAADLIGRTYKGELTIVLH